MEVFSKVSAFKESRLPSLYSDFSHLRDINPEGFEANVQAWVDLLSATLIEHTFHSSISLPGARLAAAFRINNFGEPKALGIVLASQVHEGKFVPWSIYKNWQVKSSSLADYISPIRWALRAWSGVKLSSFAAADGLGKLVDDYYLSWNSLVEVGDRIGSGIQKQADAQGTYSAKLLSTELFAAAAHAVEPNLSEVDLAALLVYLSRDTGRITVEKHEGDTFIKLDRAALTEEDRGIIKIKANISDINARAKVLEQKLDVDIPERIAQLVKAKTKDDRLKNVLIQKRQVTRLLNKSAEVLTQLNLVLEKIDDARANLGIVESLKAAQSVLSSFNNRVSIEEVNSVRDELEEQIEMTDEVSSALALTPVEDAEVDEELLLLERDEKAKEAKEIKEAKEAGAEANKAAEPKADKEAVAEHVDTSSKGLDALPQLPELPEMDKLAEELEHVLLQPEKVVEPKTAAREELA